jgi:hypothetical protein
MAEENVNLKSFVNDAKEREREYDWSGAAAVYSSLHSALPSGDTSSIGIIEEALANAAYRASFQSDAIAEFKGGLDKGSELFQNAIDTFGKSKGPGIRPYIDRCRAMIALIGFWRSERGADKKRNINEVRRLAKESMKQFEDLAEYSELVATYNRLWPDSIYCQYFEDSHERSGEPFLEGVDFGERALRNLPEKGNEDQLAVAHTLVGLYLEVLAIRHFQSSDQKNKARQKAATHWQRAVKLSSESAATALMRMANCATNSVPFGMKPDGFHKLLLKTLDRVRHTNDKYMIGSFNTLLAYYTEWMLSSLDDMEEMYDQTEKALGYANEANRNYAALSPPSPILSHWDVDPEPSILSWMMFTENDCEKKRMLAEKCVKSTVFLSISEELGLPSFTMFARGGRVEALNVFAMTEDSPEVKKKILAEAIEHEKILIEEASRLQPFVYFNRGIFLRDYAVSLYELAKLADDPQRKIEELGEAVQKSRESMALIKKDLSLSLEPLPGDFGLLAAFQFEYGTWLMNLYDLDSDRKNLDEAVSVYEECARHFESAKMPSRVAESYWKAAQICDSLGEHLKSSERFDRASKQYRIASRKIRGLGQLYKDQSQYLKAWSEIEKARYHHARQEPAPARKHYRKAAELHRSTEKWSFLSNNYSAWGQVENAENLSQRERCKESIDAFREASRLFKDSKSRMQEQLVKIEIDDEKQMVRGLIDAADNRQEFCKARIALEEARILDKGGDLDGASHKYGLAADMFTSLRKGLVAKHDQNEIDLIVTLSHAWKVMAKAESESSPKLYEDAAYLFDEAKNLSLSDKAKSLAMGHGRFCKALAAGAQFADTGDTTFHSTAIRHLESASKYYLKADMSAASEYAKASKLLFDSYVFMDKASKETDQGKKTKFYIMTEKMLEASASSYQKADQPGKRAQVLKLLARVKEDKELATSLTEVFRAPDFASTTMVFPTPTPSFEKAAGLDMFEHANVQATLIARPMDVKVGEAIYVEIELVNAGRSPAQLVKLQDLVPPGFTLSEKPKEYRMEDDHLNLKGKRLDPLKTEGIRLVIRSNSRGEFMLNPRILYLDESGKYKSHEPEPMKVVVGAKRVTVEEQAVSAEVRVAAEARSLLANLNAVTLSHYRIVGSYVRYSVAVRNSLKDARQKIVAACQGSSAKRENYIIWAPPGAGKTYFVQEVAASLGDSVHYRELNLAKLDEAGFRSGLAGLREIQGPSICLVDEIDAKPEQSWPYEALLPFLDASVSEGARFIFVLAGSSGSSLKEMRKLIASRPKGSDVLSRIPTDNEYSIAAMDVGDRLLVVLSQLRQAGKQIGREVREVEKLGLYYVAVNPRLTNARQLREFAVRCAERVLPSDDRLKYDSLFGPGDPENKLFWTQALQSAGALVNTFLVVED